MRHPVQQRTISIRVQPQPFFFRNANREIVGVRRRPADERQHFAAARVQRHHRALLARHGLRLFVAIVVNRQLNSLTRYRFLPQVAHFCQCCSQYPAHAVRADQQIVILPLQPGLSRNVAWAIFTVAGFDLLLADFADIPAGVGHEAPGQISPAVHHQHFQQRNIRAMRLDERHVRFRGFRLDDDARAGIWGARRYCSTVLSDRPATALPAMADRFFLRGGHVVAQEQHAERSDSCQRARAHRGPACARAAR